MNADAKIVQKIQMNVSQELILALDAMGGANAPQVVVEGAHLALERYPRLKFLFFGDEKQLIPLLKEYKKLNAASTVHHTDTVVDDDMKPAAALRVGRTSSMALAIKAVAEGVASGVISGGNTGAYMALSKILLKTVKGISRPAIASYLPTERGGETVMLDLGANVACDELNLVEFAIMGSVFATDVLGYENPSVGLLNIGEEDLKGSPVLRRAADYLKNYPGINFYGFIEGNDIAKGTVDVVVTDGFTGNVALKTLEGTARLIRSFLKEGFSGSLIGKIGYFFALPTLRLVFQRMNPSRYNGAIFLGLNGIAIKSHGSTDALGFSNAISVAVDMLSHGFKAQIEKNMEDVKVFLAQAELEVKTQG
ncbi:MAG TPA: phosphate acyltransferase PlsX [Alphaproteobacteria bacterium]|nr:phosphate acyltransferase PlsX [Alphaproteobacteria bacterium]HQS94017.1 phosphate acyltransferase PlsX [Alphaproteobacteria bacterium]